MKTTRKLHSFNLAFLIFVLLTGWANADTLRETYVAKLSARDHYSSRGEKLTSAAAIIRQDRANYHKFGKRDGADEWDSFFSRKSNRALLESYLKHGSCSRSAVNSIVRGTPTIVVKIFRDNAGNDFISVVILD